MNTFYNSLKNSVEEHRFEEDLPRETKSNFRYYLFWTSIKAKMMSEMNMNVILNNEPQRFLLRN